MKSNVNLFINYNSNILSKNSLLKIISILLISILVFSCSKEDDNQILPVVAKPISDVFVAGFDNASPSKSFYSKNNLRTNLTVAPNETITIAGILVDGDDIYLTGNVGISPFPGSISYQACYWKNNVKVNLPVVVSSGSSYAVATEITIVNGNVYVIGLDQDSSQNLLLWKNGVRSVYATVAAGSSLSGKSLCVFGNDVYVAGLINVGNDGSNIRATYWKNGVPTTIGTSRSFCNDIKVDQTGVHVVYADYTGEADVTAIKYWKDGTNTTISTQRPAVGKMLVKGADVYLTGAERETGSTIFKACYWKNGTKTLLSDGNALIANNIKIGVNGDVFVSSRLGTNAFSVLSYWQNNVKKTIGSSNDRIDYFDINNK